MPESSTPKSVFVTGASRGLGLETALYLAERGFRVWASVRDTSREAVVRQTARERGVELETLYVDVTDAMSIERAVSRIHKETETIFGLVNNAGITLRGYFEDLKEPEIRRVVEVNLFGVMNVTRQVLPHMRRARAGRIIVMSSIGGRIGSMGLTAYTASKFALEGFGESLSLEVRPLGIHVSLIEPGIVETDIWSRNRNIAPGAENPKSPYYPWFRQAEKEADGLVRSATVTPRVIARSVYKALTSKRPRLRYTVGRRANLVLSLRRYLPGETFERLYFGEVLRRVTRRGDG